MPNHQKILDISHKDFLSLAKAVLKKSDAIWFRAVGQSMCPSIKEGDLLLVEKVASNNLKRGDIILFEDNCNKALIHRIIRLKKENYTKLFVTKGDAAKFCDLPIDETQVLGRVAKIDRKGYKIDTTSFLNRFSGLFLSILCRLRK